MCVLTWEKSLQRAFLSILILLIPAISGNFLIVSAQTKAVVLQKEQKQISVSADGKTNAGTVVEKPLVVSILPKFYDRQTGESAVDLVRRALGANGELMAARLEIEKARARLAQARLRPNPTLEIEQTSGRFTGSGGEGDLSVGATLPLEIFGQRKSRIALAEIEITAREAEIANRERQLAADVLTSYVESLAALREIETIENLLELDLQTTRFVQIRVNEGDTAPLELNLLQTEVERLRSRRQLAEGRLESSLTKLKLLAGMDFDEPLILREQINNVTLPSFPATREAAIDVALRTRPDIRIAQIEEELAAAGLRLIRVQSKPDVAVTTRYTQSRSGFDNTPIGDLTSRDGNGNDYLKGTRTGQSGYTVNGADVTDPATGRLAFDIPLEAAESVQIEENPYSAEFGRFTGGVINLQTKGGGDKFKVSAARFFPTFHNIFSTKVDSFRPRVTFSGPVIPEKLFFLQSFEYRFSRNYVPNLPKPDDNIVQEGFNSFTQIDWNINKKNVIKFNAAIFPNRIRNLGLDTFNPPPATPNYKQRGSLFSVAEQAVFKDASFLSSEISYKTFDVDVFAKSNQPFTIAPETNSGGYFADTRRRTKRIQWQETYYTRPLKFHGEHSVKTGFEFDHTSIAGQLRYNSIFIRRFDNTLAQRVDFTSSAPLNYTYGEAAAFAQDRWVLSPKLTFDFGLRFDRDGVTSRSNFAPRFSFLFLPLKNERTIIRGGIGIFYDRSLSTGGYFDRETTDNLPNQIAEFEQIPERIVTNYAADGTTVNAAPRIFDNRISEPLRTPRSVRYSLSVDRGISKSLTARVGFLERFTKNDLLVEPITGSGGTGALLLSSAGRSRYDELQFLLVYVKPKLGQWNASYVFSRTRGDLNTADKFFGDTPAFVVRPNEYRRQPFDAPHRFLLYGQVDVSEKYDVRIAPLFEIRSGFPFSAVNERLDFVGARNGAGRFPTYLSLDFQVTKGFAIPFWNKHRARIGIVLFNLTNHFNPRDVQNNLTSPNYGKFYNSLGTSVKAKFDIDF